MHIRQEEREPTIRTLRIRNELKSLFLGTCPVARFREYFESPSYFYSQGAPDQPANWPGLEAKRLLPLWEHSGQVFALDLSAAPFEMISFYIELPDAYRTHRSIDAAVFHMIGLHVWEYGWGDEGVAPAKQLAAAIRLPNIEELNSLLDNWLNCTEEMIDNYKDSLAP